MVELQSVVSQLPRIVASILNVFLRISWLSSDTSNRISFKAARIKIQHRINKQHVCINHIMVDLLLSYINIFHLSGLCKSPSCPSFIYCCQQKVAPVDFDFEHYLSPRSDCTVDHWHTACVSPCPIFLVMRKQSLVHSHVSAWVHVAIEDTSNHSCFHLVVSSLYSSVYNVRNKSHSDPLVTPSVKHMEINLSFLWSHISLHCSTSEAVLVRLCFCHIGPVISFFPPFFYHRESSFKQQFWLVCLLAFPFKESVPLLAYDMKYQHIMVQEILFSYLTLHNFNENKKVMHQDLYSH